VVSSNGLGSRPMARAMRRATTKRLSRPHALGRTGVGVTAAAVSLALVMAGCGSSKSSSTPSGSGGTSATTATSGTTAPPGASSSSTPPNQLYNTNSTGTPVKGGTLTMLGVGDVDYMDPNISYYAIG
jgi:hypothetical protein